MLGCMAACVTEILPEQSLVITFIRGIGQVKKISLTQEVLLIIGLCFKKQHNNKECLNNLIATLSDNCKCPIH